jgi:hypothetical protein
MGCNISPVLSLESSFACVACQATSYTLTACCVPPPAPDALQQPGQEMPGKGPVYAAAAGGYRRPECVGSILLRAHS